MAKRKREQLDNEDDEFEDSATDLEPEERPPKMLRKILSHINISGPAYPRSAYDGYVPSMDQSEEAVALADLKAAFHEKHRFAEIRPEYTHFTLSDFSIYLPSCPRNAYELATLDRLQNRRGFSSLLFDGVLSVGNEKRYVQGVRFSTLTIEGYGDLDNVDLDGHIDIQSAHGKAKNVWYKLGSPSQEYKRFYDPFLWLARFTKHFMDYLLNTENVTLRHFRWSFYKWLNARYRHVSTFQSWHAECGNLRDFRTQVAAHVGYLWKEGYSIWQDDRSTGLIKHPIWGEVDPERLRGISSRKNKEQRTIVTPFTYECFKHMYFRDQLESRDVTNDAVLAQISARKAALGLTPYGALKAPDANLLTPRSMPDTMEDGIVAVHPGDVVSVEPDTNGPWKATSATWYAFVQAVRPFQETVRLDVIWLYEPGHTTLGKASYPFPNELFLSDNCDCGSFAPDIHSVTGKVDVSWFANDPSVESGLFVRQKFRTVAEEDYYDFVSLRETDFTCHHRSRHLSVFEDCRKKFQIGDTVLVQEHNPDLHKHCLEPAQVVDFKLDSQRVILRRLRRKSHCDPTAKPNELLLTEDLYIKPPSMVIRKCHVRFFHADVVNEGLPAPYDREGAGDCYFVVDTSNIEPPRLPDTSNMNEGEDSKDGPCLPSIELGLDLEQPPQRDKLQGMGIFCGGGNFDRGLEEGGAVEFRYAIDWAERAIFSYRANAKTPDKTHFFWGSVNDYLGQAINGSEDQCIARVSGIDLLAAGSPCPGFSALQPDKQRFDALRDASMVASVVSFVDFYCPKYCLLENVVTMTHGMGTNRDENVFAQILAALVALGYQVQQFHMDAWSYSSPQGRSRVFIVASAPGLEPLPHPQLTHAHPHGINMRKSSLGRSSNGLPFGVRKGVRNDRDRYTPFQHVSPAESTADLPDVGDSQPQLCPAFPDHRTPSEQSGVSRSRIAAIPTQPCGLGLVQLGHQGKLSGEPLECFQSFRSVRKSHCSNSYSRVYPDRQFPTVTTALRVNCGMSGRTLHWSQNRVLTVMELRRAQGFLDYEVILGSPAQQVVIIGNSVDRKVALALGLSLRTSWTSSYADANVLQRQLVDTAQAGQMEWPQQGLMTPLNMEPNDNVHRGITAGEQESATRSTCGLRDAEEEFDERETFRRDVVDSDKESIDPLALDTDSGRLPLSPSSPYRGSQLFQQWNTLGMASLTRSKKGAVSSSDSPATTDDGSSPVIVKKTVRHGGYVLIEREA
ncbi:hypothetical protein LTR37_005436 [Vermiconidia calcicola]|uniref:Uncharacterized protein n=1 Tax=Vermiconidia calcicola TaxID=1690605 RepID=A0ACC3NJL7_9PEZI|nr:hypothetical protein LTR37_005436 [Vermiconidia calcicola]